VRRVVIAAVAAAAAVLSLAPSAHAGPEARIVVGYDDGSFEMKNVPALTVDSAIARAERDDDVAYAERDITLHATSITPNDPMYPEQWGPQLVGAPDAWGRTIGDPSVVIAVVDTGVDASHPDLTGNVLPGKSFLNGGTSDPNGHGTAVAGVVGARGNNGIGVAGYCWQCKILPVRVLDADGSGSASVVASGIKWAVDNGADIINLSMAGPGTSDAIDSAVAYARKKNVIVLAAAGNASPDQPNQDLTVPQYPAASPGVIGVVATRQDDVVYSWSFHGSWNDLTGPGCVATTSPGARYASECGTSFASPAVAGILALGMSAFPSVSRDQLVSILLQTTAPIVPGLAANGRVDAADFLSTLAGANSTGVTATRIAGSDRIGTAIELSKQVFSQGAPDVVLARADSYADALAAAPLAAKLGAPVLLTASDGLSNDVISEIRRLGATEAWLAGGSAALSPAIESQLLAINVASAHRIAGTSRYDTARQIAAQVGGSSVFITSASAWPDAVAVSGLAAAKRAPILLVDRDSVPAATAQAINELHPTSITAIGGTGVISNGVVNQLGGATRLAGATRYDTSLAVANFAVSQGFSRGHTWVATGSDWPDALAAGPASAVAGAILVLIDGHNGVIPLSLTNWLGGTTDLTVVGGEASVTSAVASILGSQVGG
jgi:cell wall-associated protease